MRLNTRIVHGSCRGGDNLVGDDAEGLNAIQKAILVGLCMKTKGSKGTEGCQK